LFSAVGSMVAAAAGVVANAAVGVSVGTEMFTGGAVLDKVGIIGADFTSLSVLFAASGLAVATVAGASIVAGMSSDGVSY
jgi:hypothetical protein